MFKLRIYCNDDDCNQYWKDSAEEYETYDKALIACYENALHKVQSLMQSSDFYNWFEVEMDFEITEPYVNALLEDVIFFPVSVIHYDKAPWDRENDCDIKLFTGYDIVEILKE